LAQKFADAIVAKPCRAGRQKTVKVTVALVVAPSLSVTVKVRVSVTGITTVAKGGTGAL
jgi:hypothetical protein